MSNSPLSHETKPASKAATRYRQQLRRLDEVINRGGTLSGHERNCAFLRIPPNSPEEVQAPAFATASHVSGFDFADDSRSIAFTDWDRDGDVDVWVMNRTGPRVRFLQNSQTTSNGFLNMQLIGTRSNRDAIGTRVTVTTRSGSATKVLRAGEGFLSQSAKELHFGLGPSRPEPVSVSIHWPSGEMQRFNRLQPNRTYSVREGSTSAVELPLRPNSVPDDPKTPASSVTSRAKPMAIMLASRIPVPRLPYKHPDGPREVEIGKGRAILVNLWASWCLPCQQELNDLDTHGQTLSELGLDIVALSVDALPTTNADPSDLQANVKAADEKIASRAWSFSMGMATEDLVGRFQYLEDNLFAQKRNIAMPTSYLIDQKGRLAAIYRSPIDVNLLMKHVHNLSLRGKQAYDAALPFPGTWHRPRGKRTPIGMVRTLMKQNAHVDAFQYLVNNEEDVAAQPGFVATAGLLGSALTREDRTAEAIRVFRAAAEIDPDNVPIINNLAWYLASKTAVTTSEAVEAVRWASRAATLTKYSAAPVLDTLALAQEKSADIDGAKETLQLAIQLAKKNGDKKAIDALDERVQSLKH